MGWSFDAGQKDATIFSVRKAASLWSQDGGVQTRSCLSLWSMTKWNCWILLGRKTSRIANDSEYSPTFSDILRHSPTCGMAEVAEAMVPAPEPCNEPRPRRHSDELASAQAPLAPLALWQRPHRGLRLCESPDFGRPREPRDHRDHREHRDWRPPLSQSTRMKGDIFGGYKEMSIPTQATLGWRGLDSPMYAPCCVYMYIYIYVYIYIYIL